MSILLIACKIAKIKYHYQSIDQNDQSSKYDVSPIMGTYFLVNSIIENIFTLSFARVVLLKIR